MAWQGNGMGAAWEQHAMFESAFTRVYSSSSQTENENSWQLGLSN